MKCGFIHNFQSWNYKRGLQSSDWIIKGMLISMLRSRCLILITITFLVLLLNSVTRRTLPKFFYWIAYYTTKTAIIYKMLGTQTYKGIYIQRLLDSDLSNTPIKEIS